MFFHEIDDEIKPATRAWTRSIFCEIWRDPQHHNRILFESGMEKNPQLALGLLSFNKAPWDTVEWFDFGNPSDDFMNSQMEPAMKIIENNLFNMPYDQCFFKVTFGSGTERKIHTLIFIMKENKNFACIFFDLYENKNKKYFACVYDVFLIFPEEQKLTLGNVGPGTGKDENASTVLALWMMLNTRNVPKTIEPRDKHEDRKREQKGLPRVGGITHIGTRAYEAALRETQNMERTGTHASPRPHLRRGHIRTYEDGKKIWVHATIVNGSDQTKIVAREKYAVRAGDADGA